MHLVVVDGFLLTGNIGSPSCVAEETNWVLTREQLGKVRDLSCPFCGIKWRKYTPELLEA